MLKNQRSKHCILLALLGIGIAHTDAMSQTVRTDGVYRSEVQSNENATDYISILRFAPDGRVFLMQAAMPARQERVCERFRPELAQPHWAKGAAYRLDGNRLSFQTTSLSATTSFDGTVASDTLQLKLVVPTRQNLTYDLTFKFAPCVDQKPAEQVGRER